MSDSGTPGATGRQARPRGRRTFEGQVAAVFARSAHLRAGRVFITLGGPELSRHPYSIAAPRFPAGLTSGQAFRITNAAITVGDRYVQSFAGMGEYVPRTGVPKGFDVAALRAALHASRRRIASLPDQGGLHPLLRDQDQSVAGPLAAGFLDAARSGARRAAAGVRRRDFGLLDEALCLLAGLGVGLTPSGDDFLAGLFAALRFHGRSGGFAVPEARLRVLAGRTRGLTSDFSAFLVRCAARGLVSDRVCAWLLAAHAGGLDAADRAEDLAGIGHSSGVDAFAGMLLALQAVTGESTWAE